MCDIPNDTSSRLRVTQAYIALLIIPDGKSPPKIISVASIGKYEIRMFNASPGGFGNPPPVWIELFDPAASVSVDSCVCHEIEDAVAAFEHLALQAQALE